MAAFAVSVPEAFSGGFGSQVAVRGVLILHWQFDPRNIFNAESASPNEREVAKELSRALFIV